LVDKSLVLFETDGKPARYRLLETIRQYAVEKLLTSAEVSSVRKRHRDWYLELAERGEQELQGREQVSWLDRLAREHDNFRAALEFCKAGDVDKGLRLAAALRHFWYVRGYWREGRNWLETFLSLGGGTSVQVRARALYQAGMLQDYSAEGYQRRTRLLTESLDLYSHLDDKPGIAYAKRALGHTAFLQGDHERAVSCVGESLPLFRELGDKWGLANGLNTLGHQCIKGICPKAQTISQNVSPCEGNWETNWRLPLQSSAWDG
jgi:non-specific serine/threonine protein kinase